MGTEIMDIVGLLELIGDSKAAALAGLVVGAMFGFSAQRSKFCLRAATVEFAHGHIGPRTTVWLLTFATALFWTQVAATAGLFEPLNTRMLAVSGSISGAILGGAMFGVGMIMARGCSGRLLVLSATGNLRSLISGLVFAVTAQTALHGFLAPLRNWLAAIWTTPNGTNIQWVDALSLPDATGVILATGFTGLALWAARQNRVRPYALIMASGVGFSVAVGWVLTSNLAASSFTPMQIESASFTGPSADALMFLLGRDEPLSFAIGMMAGVFAGSFSAAILSREFKFQGFDGPAAMRRYLSGAILMGFGGMLAGGCAIGAGVTGGSVFSLTAWIALTSMWFSAMIADRLIESTLVAQPT